MIVMDPPWQNASVDRMGHYGTFDLYELFKIPIPDLLSPVTSSNGSEEGEGGVVAVWITNRAKIRKVVVEKLFPAWGLELVAHWYWLKVSYLLIENGNYKYQYQDNVLYQLCLSPRDPNR